MRTKFWGFGPLGVHRKLLLCQPLMSAAEHEDHETGVSRHRRPWGVQARRFPRAPRVLVPLRWPADPCWPLDSVPQAAFIAALMARNRVKWSSAQVSTAPPGARRGGAHKPDAPRNAAHKPDAPAKAAHHKPEAPAKAPQGASEKGCSPSLARQACGALCNMLHAGLHCIQAPAALRGTEPLSR